MSGSIDSRSEWLSPVFALIIIVIIMLSILAACYYAIRLLPLAHRKKRIAFLIAALIVSVLLFATAVLVMYISRMDLTDAVTNALWAFYPLCSLSLFVLAVVIAIMYKRITDPHDKKLAKYFLIAFIPQCAFSLVDFLLMRDIAFQFTHVAYSVFSVFVFLDLSKYFFKHYDTQADITDSESHIQKQFDLSDREIEVVEFLIKGETNQTIGDHLHISINTVKSHIKSIYKKLSVSNRLQLVNKLNDISK